MFDIVNKADPLNSSSRISMIFSPTCWLREKSRSRFSCQESRFLVLFSLFSISYLPWKTIKRMQNSTTFDKIFLPQFTKSITFWLHVKANVKRTEFIIYNSIPKIQYIVFFKVTLWGKCLFISTSPVSQCMSLKGCRVLIWCAWHTPLKTGKIENP